jgi:Flp pilus assembly protein TadD
VVNSDFNLIAGRMTIAQIAHHVVNAKHSAGEMNESAMIHHARGDVKNAMSHLQMALLRDPEYAEAWANRGMILAQNEAPFDAIMAYDRAISRSDERLPGRESRSGQLARPADQGA